jgi:hypothetical protein
MVKRQVYITQAVMIGGLAIMLDSNMIYNESGEIYNI